jgi:hypothetical protein
MILARCLVWKSHETRLIVDPSSEGILEDTNNYQQKYVEASMKQKHRVMRFTIALLALVALSLLGSRTNAQTFFGAVAGTVTDNSGAVVPNATVTITNIGTNDTRTAKTNEAGEYRFVNLVPADYKIAVEAANFKRFLRPSVTVAVATTVRVDAALLVGAASETVEVTTQAPLLQTESGTLGDTVEAKQMQEIPLNGRNSLNLMALVPGIVPLGNTSGSAAMNNNGSTSSAAWGNYQIGGGLPLQGTILVDGAPTTIMQKSFDVLVPTQDTIQEFKVETAGVSAEFGRLGGGVVNMTTKSGTNQFHGAAYEYFRNNVLNANNFFSKRNNLKRPQYNQNQYGGIVGGPIWKNKAFFFLAYEQISIRTGAPVLTNVPTAAMQAGIFNTSTFVPSTDPGADGCTFAAYTGQSVNGVTAAAGGYYIPNLSTCRDQTAKILATFYPLPNSTTDPAHNYIVTQSQGDDGHQFSGRADWNITKNNQFFARFTLWPLVDEVPVTLASPTGFNTGGSQTHNHTNNIVAGDTHTFNATTVLDLRADYIRQYGDAIPPAFGKVSVSQFGTNWANLAPSMTYQYYPGWGITGNHNLFSNFGYTNLTRTFYNNYHLSGSLTKIVGKHDLKFGAEGRLIQRDDNGNQNSSGNFTIKNDVMGDEWANFLLGYSDSVTLSTAKKTTSYSYYNAYYAEDTWQALQKLTLNLGFRYELPGAIAENANNMAVLLPNLTDAITGITGTEALVASPQYSPRTTMIPVHSAVGPRFGFAYRLTNDTVIRGGYGLTYLPNDQQTGAYANAATFNAQATTSTNITTGSFNTTTGALTGTISVPNTMANPFPSGILPAKGRALTNFMALNVGAGSAIVGPSPYEPYPMSQGMNLSISHQFKGDLLIEVGGAHTLGTHLNTLGNIGLNQVSDANAALYGSALAANKTPGGTAISITTPGGTGGSYTFGTPLTAGSYSLVTPPAGASVPTKSLLTYGQTLRPYMYYKNYSNSTDFHSTSSYNALEAKVQKRFKSSGQIGVAYTWSKLISDTDSILTSQEAKTGGSSGEGVYQDYTNRKADRAIYSYNTPSRLVVNYLLNLPFGQGQKFAGTAKGVVNAVISGWAMDGITTFQSGFPLYLYLNGTTGGVSNTTYSSSFGAATMRPNYTSGCNKNVSGSGFARTLTGATWFNTACFTTPGVGVVPGSGVAGTTMQGYTFGNEPRVDGGLKTSGVDNWDFSVVKNTQIHEQIGAQFRVEFYNIFNRVQFGPPNTQADNSQFGQVSTQRNAPRLIQGALRINF